jgi:hypothetical protein
MTDKSGQSVKASRRWWNRSRAAVIAALLVGLVLSVSFAWHYRFHFLWLHAAKQSDLASIQAVPDRPMPELSVPDNWVKCQVGRVEFRLPPELANNEVLPKGGSSMVIV